MEQPAQWASVSPGAPQSQWLVSEVNWHWVSAHRPRNRSRWAGHHFILKILLNPSSRLVPSHFPDKAQPTRQEEPPSHSVPLQCGGGLEDFYWEEGAGTTQMPHWWPPKARLSPKYKGLGASLCFGQQRGLRLGMWGGKQSWPTAGPWHSPCPTASK